MMNKRLRFENVQNARNLYLKINVNDIKMKVASFDMMNDYTHFHNFYTSELLTDTNVIIIYNTNDSTSRIVTEMKLKGFTCEKYSLLKDADENTSIYLIFVHGLYRIDNSIYTYNTHSRHKTYIYYRLKDSEGKIYDLITTLFDERIGLRNQQLTQLTNFASTLESENVLIVSRCSIMPQHELALFVMDGYSDAWFEKGTSEELNEERNIRFWCKMCDTIDSYNTYTIDETIVYVFKSI